MRKTVVAVCLFLSLSLLASCALFSGKEEGENGLNPDKVIITVKDYGVIKAELYPETAPVTVANFKRLVSEHYYDGLTFHRIVNGFMIQGGRGAYVPSIKGEFEANGTENGLKHERGVLSMARSDDMDSASSQFFICHTTEGCRHLDGNYAAFGRVTEGMEVVDAIAGVPTGYMYAPLTAVIIEKIEFDTSK